MLKKEMPEKKAKETSASIDIPVSADLLSHTSVSASVFWIDKKPTQKLTSH